MSNSHGYHCPNCTNADQLRITATIIVHLLAEGVDTTGSDTEWGDDSRVDCYACGWSGKVWRLVTVKEEVL